jgi:hypothetical protein
MKLCEQCGQAPPFFPGSRTSAGQFCGDCLHEKADLILDVFQVINHYGVQEET